jgi:hypothetical protein
MEAKMPSSVSNWVTPLIPVVLMVTIVITNHVVMGQRTDKKTATEASRFSTALAAELRAMLDLYNMNLDFIEKKNGYLLSTRTMIAIYKGNLGRLTLLLEEPAIAHVVEVFAQNERIESVVAAHSNLKCNLTYQFSPTDAKYDEWKQMYEQASRCIMSACKMLEDNSRPCDSLSNYSFWRLGLDQFLHRMRNPGEIRLSAG